jgi:hypothetical protein
VIGEREDTRVITCSIVGCRCEGKRDDHRTLKAYEGGFVYYAASYWQRYCEPSGVYVSLVPGKAETAAVAGMEEEERDQAECCGNCGCDRPDLCTGGEFTYKARDLFSARELMENRHALLSGEVVYLSR